MQRERGGRKDVFDMGDPFSSVQDFGSLRSHRSMIPSLFGGRDPFDDPFFTRPIDTIYQFGTFGQSANPTNTPQTNQSKGVVIEELNSDPDGEEENKGSHKPSVEHPDDDVHVDERRSKSVNYRNQYNKVEGTQPQVRSFGFSKVTYGGVDGAYYTSTTTRRTTSDGVVLEESKEADRTTGQAKHRISRGIHDKGHSVTRKLDSDGKVDTMQTLHNLNEDELAGFEEAWKGNVKLNLPSGSHEFDMDSNAGSSGGEQNGEATRGGWALPTMEQAHNAGRMMKNDETRASRGGSKKVVRINID